MSLPSANETCLRVLVRRLAKSVLIQCVCCFGRLEERSKRSLQEASGEEEAAQVPASRLRAQHRAAPEPARDSRKFCDNGGV